MTRQEYLRHRALGETVTEYSHVTASVEVFGNAKVNLSRSQIFVDEAADGWSRANELVRYDLRQTDEKFFYKTASRIYLWENYFQNAHRVKTLPFWENVLDDLSDLDSLDIHDQTKTVIRKTLLEVIGHYLNADCLLLPLVKPRHEETPAWHAQVKPDITGHPYETFLEWYKAACENRKTRLRAAGGRYRFIFSSVRIPAFADYTVEVDECVSVGLKEANLTSDEMSDCRMYLQELASKCPVECGRKPFTTHLSSSGYLRRFPTSNVFRQDVEDMPSRDPILTMRTHVEKRLKRLGIECHQEWLDEIESWISTRTNTDISPLYGDVLFLCEWLAACGLSDKRSDQLSRRQLVKHNGENPSFFEYLKKEQASRHAKSRIIRNLVDFFAFSSDGWLDGLGRAIHSPLNESDKKRFTDTSARERGKSNKPVLPRRIIEMAKQVLTEDDYAFPRSFDDQFIAVDGEELFVPTVSNLLYLILSLPIRTAQAVMLDSGEADEFVVALDGTQVKNMHPLACKGRMLGYARRFAGTSIDTQFSGLFVNTNKEAVHEQKGYEIPFHDAKLMNILAAQRLFQEQFNPVSFAVNRSQLYFKDWRYNGSQVDQLESYTFLFRDIFKGTRRWDLPSRNAINKQWLRLLLEIQLRLEAEGAPVQLVWEDSNGKLRTEFTLHSLRVSNITHFIEAGVPLHVLAEFLSGHQTLVMTLYYTKLGPRKIHEVIAEASRNLVEADEDEFFDRLTEMSSELLNEQVVGKKDGLARLPDGDPGLWHVDVDGFCTAGKSSCEEGLERVDTETGIASYEPIYPDGFNCALCRFHITGPAFLAGQVTVANTLFYAIRERSEQQDKLFKMVTEARSRGNNREARRAQDQLDKVEIELEERIAVLGARIGNIYASLDIMNDQDESGSMKAALITKLEAPEIEARLAEATNFEGIEWASQTVEFFPQIPDSGARFRKGILLERMAQENGLKPLLLHLSDDEMHRASNRLTALMTDFYGQQETTDLISGKVKLEELGGMHNFKSLVGKAVELCAPEAPQLDSPATLIGAAGEQ